MGIARVKRRRRVAANPRAVRLGLRGDEGITCAFAIPIVEFMSAQLIAHICQQACDLRRDGNVAEPSQLGRLVRCAWHDADFVIDFAFVVFQALVKVHEPAAFRDARHAGADGGGERIEHGGVLIELARMQFRIAASQV